MYNDTLFLSDIMKKCKYCGTNKNLRKDKIGRIYNVCKFCFSKNHSILEKQKYIKNPELRFKVTKNANKKCRELIKQRKWILQKENRNFIHPYLGKKTNDNSADSYD